MSTCLFFIFSHFFLLPLIVPHEPGVDRKTLVERKLASNREKDRERETGGSHAECEAAQRQCLMNWTADQFFLHFDWTSQGSRNQTRDSWSEEISSLSSLRGRKTRQGRGEEKESIRDKETEESSTNANWSRGAQGDAQRDQIVARKARQVASVPTETAQRKGDALGGVRSCCESSRERKNKTRQKTERQC